MNQSLQSDNLHINEDSAEVGILPVDTIKHPDKKKHHQNFADKLFGVAGATSVAMAVTPLALRQLGIGLEHTRLDGACCEIIKNAAADHDWMKHQDWNVNLDGTTETVYGVAGWMSGLLSHIPFGEEMLGLEKTLLGKLECLPFVQEGTAEHLDATTHPLARGGLMNALVAGSVVLIGHYGGKAIDHFQTQKAYEEAVQNGVTQEELDAISANRSMMSKVVQDGSKLLGFAVLIPSIFPGIGHSMLSVSATTGVDTIDYDNAKGTGPITSLAAFLGKNPGACKRTGKLYDAIEGSSSALISQLCCALPAITGSIPALMSLATGNGKVHVDAPDYVVLYDAKDRQEESSKQALAELSEFALQRRLSSNQFHLQDTHDSLESSKGLRNVLKVGSAVAATVGTGALAAKHFLGSEGPQKEAFNGAVKNAYLAPNPNGEFHDIYQTDTGNRYIGLKFPESYEQGVEQALSGQDALEGGIPIAHPENPIKIVMQKALCTFNDQKNPAGVLCSGFDDMCCGDVYFHKSAVDKLIIAGRALSGSGITQNRALTIGGASAALGAVVYNVAERLFDKPAQRKIEALENENTIIEAILEGKQSQKPQSYAGKITQEKQQSDLSQTSQRVA